MPYGIATSAFKCLLMMKMIILLVCSFSLQSIANNGFAQEKITLRLENATFRKAFKAIEKQTSFRFVYNEEVLPPDQKVSISVQAQPVDDVMQKLLANTSLTFKIIGSDLIVISSTLTEIALNKAPAFEVKGKIINPSNEPVVGVSVVEKGTTNGTVTKEDGSFSLTVSSGNAVLVISSVGYTTQEISIKNRNAINISLQESNNELNQVVVVGYGTQKRTDITGAVASVPKSRLNEIPVTNVFHAIEGSVAGVTVTQNSSVPGSSATVLVRGQNSINANSGPFVVVDGIPFSTSGGFSNDINPNDIASIEVLKDASAVAIYGTRGSQGVILITTKRGNSGKPVIRYNAYTGFENIAHVLQPRNAAQYVQKYADYLKEAGLVQTQPVPNQFELVNYNAGKTTDWIKETTQTGLLTDNNISISGGTKDVHYYISGEYLKEKGVVKGYQYNRTNFRSNLDINVTSYLTVGTSLFFTGNNYDGGTANLLFATAMSPYGQEYDAQGHYAIYPMYPELLYTNPLIGLYTDQLNRSKNLNGNGYAEVKFGGALKGLKFRINLADSYVPTRQGNYTGRAANNTIGGASVTNTENNTWVIENILSYARDWKKHHIDFTGLYSSQKTNYFASGIGATGFVNDLLSFYNLGAGATISAGSLPPLTNISVTNGSFGYQSSLLSQMGRINYSYDNKYLFTFTARRDGYSAFGVNTDKYGTFPSVAVGWNIYQEDFMKLVTFVNNLKIRASYGKSGNQAVGVNQTATLDQSVRYPFEGISTIGVLASIMGNENLHWETTTGLNVGVDFSILSNRVVGTIDYYRTTTRDLLLKRNIPIITGYSNVWDNLGELANRGIELTLNTRNIDGHNFRWETMIAFSTNKNKLVDLYGDKKSDVGNRWFIGHPVNVIYDYKLQGIWQTGEDPSKQDPTAKPGDLKFADVNGDQKITADLDKVVLGQTSPKWIGGLTNTFHYKNFNLSIFIQTAQGMMKNNPDLNYVDESGRRNTPAEIGYWTPDNKNNTRPALSYTNTRGYGYASDASYTRIKDITFSYVLSSQLVDRLKLGSLTFYVSGRNLHTFTKWIGWDPENDYVMRGGANFQNNYPVVRSVVFGANVTLR